MEKKLKNYQLTINNNPYSVLIKEVTDSTITAEVNGEIHVVAVDNIQNVSPLVTELPHEQSISSSPAKQLPVSTNGEVQPVKPVKNAGAIHTPIPGQIININVSKGDKVLTGQKLMVLEAMKLENVITSTVDGTVKNILISEGEVVQQGQLLIDIE